MKTAVMTDENSGIMPNEAEELGIFVMPMPFFVDGKLTFQGENFTRDDFFAALDRGAEVSTSQPSPGDVIDMWKSILAQGYDNIVYVPMSSGLSESCSNALVYSEEFNGKVQVADNHRISVTMKQSVYDALNYAKTGMSALEIKERLEKEAYDASIFIAVDTLSYLKKGGRITAAAAAIGTVLNLKPVLSIQGEKLDAYAKERGMKKARHTMINAMKKDIEGKLAEFVYRDELSLYAVASQVDDETFDDWAKEVSEAFPGIKVEKDYLSLSVSCHIGPGSLAIAACRKS